MLFSELGGNFPNDLSYIRLKANDQGVATTTWASRGDGVADCHPLEKISPLAKAASKKATTPSPSLK